MEEFARTDTPTTPSPDGQQQYREVSFAEMVGDPRGFGAHGECALKVQRGAETLIVKVHVVSIPQDILAGIRRKAPRPPSKLVEDRASRQKTFAPDLADPKYLDELEAHQQLLLREAVGRGIDEPTLTFRDGRPASTPADRYAALEEWGLTATHFNEIMQKILRLTDWTEEEREAHL